jgi:hypothetical protein
LTLLSELLPEYDFAEVHRVRVADPARALAGAMEATPREMPLVRMLFALRSGPAQLKRGRGLPRDRARSLAEQMIDFGFVPLAEDEHEIVVGFVGQPWKLTGGEMPRLLTADAWRAFDEPGFVKAVMNFRVDGNVLSTETRVLATDARTRRKFRPYWLVIRPWSGLIRRSWLRAAKRRVDNL